MSKYGLKTTKLPKSEVEIEAELSSDELTKARSKAIQKFNNSLNIPGFRAGKIPENIIIQNIGEAEILSEAAEIAVNEHYPEILKELGFSTIGRPTVSIIKLAFGNPFLFKVKTSVLPDFKLPDYKKLAKAEMSTKEEVGEVTEKDIDDVILQVRKNKAHSDWHTANPDEKPARPSEAGRDHSTHPDFEDEKNLPEVTDEFAKTIGGFADIAEMRIKVKENVTADKKLKLAEKKRAAIMEKLITETEIDIPDLLIESEIDKSLGQMKDDIARIGGKFEDYLEHTKKTEDEMRVDLRADAEKKAKIQLIFNKIADEEKIVPDGAILDHETKKILEYYPEANEINARIYVATMLTNQEVLKLLERQ